MSPKSKSESNLPLNPAKAASWEVRSRGAQCDATGEPFEEGEVFMSRLSRTPEGLAREDFKLRAWSGERKAEALFYWKTQFRLPPPKKEEPFKEENAEEAMRDLLERNDPARVNTIYILAVMLERKRVLIERGDQRDADGRRVRIYEHKDNGETFFVLDPELELDQIVDVQREVALELGWIEEGEEVGGRRSEDEEKEEVGGRRSGEEAEAKNPNSGIDNPPD